MFTGQTLHPGPKIIFLDGVHGLRGLLVGICSFQMCFIHNRTSALVGIRMKDDETPIDWPSFP